MKRTTDSSDYTDREENPQRLRENPGEDFLILSILYSLLSVPIRAIRNSNSSLSHIHVKSRKLEKKGFSASRRRFGGSGRGHSLSKAGSMGVLHWVFLGSFDFEIGDRNVSFPFVCPEK